ncbi:hypothetical protein MAR_037759 [Mya arenaria]|uniref:Uncharacterized protein n=1 Tax=Mya arenaria TaxID=6604 RepID=A0ABY7FPY1_MYAAR|nr:hypothetical protein MAR_037759 [Mya arenaria]
MPRLEQMAANDTNSQEPNEENENLENLGPQEPMTRSGSVRSGSFRHHKHLHRHNQLGNRDGNNGGTDNDVSGRENVTQQPTNNRPVGAVRLQSIKFCGVYREIYDRDEAFLLKRLDQFIRDHALPSRYWEIRPLHDR